MYVLVDSRGFQKLYTILVLIKKARISEVLSSFRASPGCLVSMECFARSGHSRMMCSVV